MKTILFIFALAALSTSLLAGEACKNAARTKASPAPSAAKTLARHAAKIAAKRNNHGSKVPHLL